MTKFNASRLAHVLVLDAVTCAGMGLALSLFAGPLSGATGLPRGLLLGAGLLLFPVAALMAMTAARGWAWAVPLILAGNLAWVLASVALLVAFRPTVLGVAFVLLQGLAVLALAGLEWRAAGGRRATAE